MYCEYCSLVCLPKATAAVAMRECCGWVLLAEPNPWPVSVQKRWAGLRDFSLIIQRVGVWIEKSLPGDVLVLVADTSVLHSAFPLLSSSRRPPLVLPLFGHHLQSTFSAVLPLPPQPLNILDSLSVFLNVWSLLKSCFTSPLLRSLSFSLEHHALFSLTRWMLTASGSIKATLLS